MVVACRSHRAVIRSSRGSDSNPCGGASVVGKYSHVSRACNRRGHVVSDCYQLAAGSGVSGAVSDGPCYGSGAQGIGRRRMVIRS